MNRPQLDRLGARVAWLEDRVTECELGGADARLLRRALIAARAELATCVRAASVDTGAIEIVPAPPLWLRWLRWVGVRVVVLVLR